MTVSILTFASGDTDYITKHNTNNASIKSNVDANEAAIAAIVAPGYDIGSTYNGAIPDGAVLLRYPMPRAIELPVGLTASAGVAAVTASSQAVFNIQKNGGTVGTMTFAAASTTATFSAASATTFAAGDVLTVVGPATADSTLADIGLSLAGMRV